MRLIDADTLIEKYQKEIGIDVFRYDVLRDLEDAPIVDAVPVSFLEKLRENAQNKETVLTIYEIITLWRIKECD